MASKVDQKLLKQTKFPPEFGQKVDMKKVNLEVMKKWIAGRISAILANEDDVVIELCFNLLESVRFPDIKALQISLTGFLEKDTAQFCKELWNLCLSAQTSPQGVPKELLEAKKQELMQEKLDAERLAGEARRRQETERARERDADNIRQRERGDRGDRGDRRGRGDGRRGGFGGRDFDRRPRRDHSTSPPPRRRGSPERNDFRGPPPRRDMDTYIPTDRRGGRTDAGRRRRPSRSRSRSASLPRSRTPSPPRQRPRDDEHTRSRRRRYSPSRSRSASTDRAGRRPEGPETRGTPPQPQSQQAPAPQPEQRSTSPATSELEREQEQEPERQPAEAEEEASIDREICPGREAPAEQLFRLLVHREATQEG
ncbi:MAG: hypothetical protein M1832_001832 [Thelocarpon impressellum]|nr:MAG: hypothetical protein M1832_001832 [Thelocarpon impressellum]